MITIKATLPHCHQPPRQWRWPSSPPRCETSQLRRPFSTLGTWLLYQRLSWLFIIINIKLDFKLTSMSPFRLLWSCLQCSERRCHHISSYWRLKHLSYSKPVLKIKVCLNSTQKAKISYNTRCKFSFEGLETITLNSRVLVLIILWAPALIPFACD